MAALGAAGILQAWDSGHTRGPMDRALILLAAGFPGVGREDLLALSVGQRDDQLLVLREQTIGPSFDIYAECPRCQERLEFQVAVADVRAPPTETTAAGDYCFARDDLEVWYRLPNTADMIAISHNSDVASARLSLLSRCIQRAQLAGMPVDPVNLSEDAILGLGAEMAERDPRAEVLIALTCPGCEHGWRALFEVAEIFWTEIASRAKRLLREVHLLARAYGWREAEILALSPTRRQAYLELVTE